MLKVYSKRKIVNVVKETLHTSNYLKDWFLNVPLVLIQSGVGKGEIIILHLNLQETVEVQLDKYQPVHFAISDITFILSLTSALQKSAKIPSSFPKVNLLILAQNQENCTANFRPRCIFDLIDITCSAMKWSQ